MTIKALTQKVDQATAVNDTAAQDAQLIKVILDCFNVMDDPHVTTEGELEATGVLDYIIELFTVERYEQLADTLPGLWTEA